MVPRRTTLRRAGAGFGVAAGIAYPAAMTKRPPQGRGSGGRVTPSAKATEAAAAEAKAAPKGRVPRSTRAARTPEGTSGAKAGSDATSASGATAGTAASARAGRADKPAKAAKPAKATTADAAATTATKRGRGLEPTGGGVDAPEDAPVWGMGDMVIWWLVSFVATAVVSIVIGGFLVSSGTFEAFWPNDEGWAVGEVAGRIGLGQEPQVTVGLNGAPLWLQIVFQIPLWAVLVIGPIYVARRKGLSLRDDFGLSAKAIDAPIGLVIGVASQLLLVPALYWLFFKVVGEQDVSASARALTTRADDIWGLLALVLIVGVGAPFAEEIFYRGLSQHAIAKRYGPRLAILFGAAFFALSHLQAVQFLGLFAFGLVLGTLTDRFNRLGPAIFAHIGFNLTAAAVLVWNLPLA